MFDTVIFGQNIQRLRNSRRLTKQEFADQCGMSYYTIRSYTEKRSSTTIGTILKICRAFSVSPNELLDGMYDRPTEQEYIDLYSRSIDNLQPGECALVDDILDAVTDCLHACAPSLVNADFGARLRVCREEAGYSASRFAKLLSISQPTLSNIESSQTVPSAALFLEMCAALHVSPDLLLGGVVDAVNCPAALRGLSPKQMKCVALLIERFQKYLVELRA